MQHLPAGYQRCYYWAAVLALFLPEFDLRKVWESCSQEHELNWRTQNQGINLAHECQQSFIATADALDHFFQQYASHTKLTEQFPHLRMNGKRGRRGQAMTSDKTQTCISSTSRWNLKCSSLSSLMSASRTSFWDLVAMNSPTNTLVQNQQYMR